MGYTELVKFGEWIRDTRVAKGWSMRQLATALGVSAPYLSDVEKGRRMALTAEKLEAFARILELNDSETETLYELAATARDEPAVDNMDYMRENPYVSLALRRMRIAGADRDDWAWMLDELYRRKGLK